MKTLFFLLLTSFSFGQTGLGELQGVVVDQNGELLLFTRVLVYNNLNVIVGGAETDFDGRFFIRALEPGSYSVKIKEIDDEMKLVSIDVYADRITYLGEIVFTLPEIIGCDFGYHAPIIPRGEFFGGPTIIKSEDIRIRY